MANPELECRECGMIVHLGEDHPYACCLMFKGCYDRDTVNANFQALKNQWIELGKKLGKQENDSQSPQRTT